MKRIIIIILFLLMFTQIGFSKRLLWTSLSANVFSHNDKNYKEFYGNFLIAPEAKISIDVFSGIFLWTSALYVPATWESVEYNIKAESKQLFLSLGFGDQMHFSENIKGVFELGLMYMIFKEEVDEDSMSGSDLGFIISTGLNYRLAKNIHLSGTISYLKGASSIGDKEIKLGGLKASIGIELTLFNKKEE